MEPKKKFMLNYIKAELDRIGYNVESPHKWRGGQIDGDFFEFICGHLDALEEEIRKVCIDGKTEGFPSIDMWNEENEKTPG